MKTSILHLPIAKTKTIQLSLGFLFLTLSLFAQKSTALTNNDGSNSKTSIIQDATETNSLSLESSLPSSCNFYSEIEISNFSQGGEPVDEVGCSTNDTVQVCIRILNFVSETSINGCQYLHGLVPQFDCLTPLEMTTEGEPGIYTSQMTNNSGTGVWLWYPEGVVTYNNIPNGFYAPFEPVGAGWFYTFAPGNDPTCTDYSNPNCTWGDGINCASGFTWEVCFLATLDCIAADLESGPNLCTFSFRTFGDGETGGFTTPGCELDQPYEYDFIGECCQQPVIENEQFDFEVCSGDEFSLDLLSDMDPETTYDWVVEANPYGATSGSGTTITDVLTNPTSDPVTVSYYVTPTCAMGCVGQSVTINVTINPEIILTANAGFNPVCDFECVPLFAFASGGVPPFTYQWSDGQFGPNPIVCPFPGFNIYTVTVTDSNGCTETAEVFIDVFDPLFVQISATSLEDCDVVTLSADIISPGFGNYSYFWSNGENTQSITVSSSGTYSVEVIDDFGACVSNTDQVSVIIFPQPEPEIIGPNTLCINDGFTCFDAIPAGGIWGGAADPNGCIDPSGLGAGIYTITYHITDDNGCEGSTSYSFEVIQDLQTPDQLPDVQVCEDTQTLSFSIGDVPNASSYSWTTSGSLSVINGQGTNTIEILTSPGGGSICVRAVGNCGPSEEMCFTITVDEIPIPEFVMPAESCVNQEVSIAFTGIANAASAFLWDFGGGSPNTADPESNPFDISWGSPGTYTVSLQIENANCISDVFILPIEISEDLPEPVINCTSTTSSVDFFWEEVPGASGYLVNGINQSGTSYSVNGLNPDETVSITVTAINSGLCDDSFASASCTTTECNDLFINIAEVGTVCLDAGLTMLQVDPDGGIWSGNGVIDPIGGTFDPNIAGAGIHTLTYQLFSGPCIYESSIDVEVVDANTDALNINCAATVNSVSFTWNEIPGVTGYLVNGQFQNGSSFIQSTQPGELVNITVETVGAGICGEITNSLTCQAEDCPVIDVQILEIGVVCQDAGSITLQASEPNGIWSGSCITDSIGGIFDPLFAPSGINTITYTLMIGQCAYSSTIDIIVEEPIDVPIISCSSSIDEVLFSWNPVFGATGYLVNGNFQTGTSYVESTTPGETVTIIVEAISNNSCGGTIESASCTADECEGGLILTPLDPLCQSDGILFLEANIAGGLWSGPGVIDPFSGALDPNIAQEGIHTITYLLITGPCNAEVSMEVEVTAPLNDLEVTCSTSPEGLTFNWSPIDGISGYLVNGVEQSATSYTVAASPGEEVSISVEAISTGPCPNVSTTASCIAACPTVSIDIPPVENICLGESPLAAIELEVNVQGTAGQGLWSGPGIIDPVSGLFDPNLANIGTHQISYEIQNGSCSYNQNGSVIIAEMPDVEAGASVTLTCDNPVLTLAGSGQGALTWGGPGLIFGGETNEPLVNASGMYWLTVADPLTGCSASDQVEVFEDKVAPIAMANPDQLITCEHEVVTISVETGLSGNNTLQWSGPGINQNNESVQIAEVDVPGIYQLIIRDEDNGCVSEPDTVLVSQNTIPPSTDASIAGMLDCSGSLVSLEAMLEEEVVYSWLLPGNDTITSEMIEINEAGSYTLFAASLFNGCTNSQTFEIENNAEIPVADAGTDQVINCIDQVATLDGSNSDAGDSFEYLWTRPDGSLSGPLENSEMETDLPGMYVLQVINNFNSCIGLDTVIVEADLEIPEVDAGADQELGCIDEQLALSGVVSAEAGSVNWKNEEGEIITTAVNTLIDAPGWYYLTVTNLENGCTNVDSVLITEDTDVPYAIEVSTKDITCHGDRDGAIAINAILGGSAPYQFAIGSEAYVDQPFRDNLESGTYEISVMDADGCVYSENVVIPEKAELTLDLGNEIISDLGEEHIVNVQMDLNPELLNRCTGRHPKRWNA